jgi:hypothetical protein
MTITTLKEFIRRLTAEGYEPDLDETGAGTVRDWEQSISIMDDGEIRYKLEHSAFAYRVRDIRDEVEEYMTAFMSAASGVERFRRGGKTDTRTLMLYNGHELAVRQHSGGSIEFVTWIHARGHRDIGHYFDSYAAAKEDYALRCGLIDRRKLFTETELLIIRQGLVLCADITPDRGMDEVRQIRSLVEKIDDLTIPQIAEDEWQHEAVGEEPEMELFSDG